MRKKAVQQGRSRFTLVLAVPSLASRFTRDGSRELPCESRTPLADFFRILLEVCPSNAVLLRQATCRHLRRSRPETILNVFQRIRLRVFHALRRSSTSSAIASQRRLTRTDSQPTLFMNASPAITAQASAGSYVKRERSGRFQITGFMFQVVRTNSLNLKLEVFVRFRDEPPGFSRNA